MATTTATLYWRPMLTPAVAPGRITSAALYASIRLVSGRYSSTAIAASSNDKNKRVDLPPRSVKYLDDDGCVSLPWYLFHQYDWNHKQGGITSATVPDIAAAVTRTELKSAVDEAVATALKQQVTANAASLSAVVQVAQTAALPGAMQIPPVQLTSGGEGGSE